MARGPLSQMRDWSLTDQRLDLRGRPLLDRYENQIGAIREMIVDTERSEVVTVVLDSGVEYSTEEIEVGETAVYLREPRVATAGSASIEPPRLRCSYRPA